MKAGAVQRYVLAVYARTPEEARAPLERRSTPVADAFDIDTIRTDPLASPYLDRWRADGDAAAYGRA